MKDGEYKCYECKGSGEISNVSVSKWYYECLIKCPICKGTGKLDWISNIIEPKNNGKLEMTFKAKAVNPPIDIIKIDFIIDKEGIVK